MDMENSPVDSSSSGWIGSLLSTIATLLAFFAAYFFVGLSPMACDSCAGAELDRFDASYSTASDVFFGGLVLPAGLVIATWVLSESRRHPTLLALLWLLAPVSVGLLYLVFSSLVDWP